MLVGCGGNTSSATNGSSAEARTSTSTVQEVKVTRLVVSAKPTKTKYSVGEKFDPTGMVVTAIYSNGIREEVKDYTYDKTGEFCTIFKKMAFEIPTLIDGEYYYINGNRFYPIYQLLDATTFHKENSVTLKTLTLPIKLTRVPTAIFDVNGNQYTSYIFYTDIQRKKVNMLAFFFATIGFFRTLKYFEGPQPMFFICSEDKVVKDDPEGMRQSKGCLDVRI